MKKQRIKFITNFQSEACAGYLRNDLVEPCFEVDVGEYDQLMQEVLLLNQGAAKDYKSVFIWALPEKCFLEFKKCMNLEKFSIDLLMDEVDRYLQGIVNASKKAPLFHLSFQPGFFTRSNGSLKNKSEIDLKDCIRLINQKLHDLAKNNKNLYILDSELIYHFQNKENFNTKLWYLSKNPFVNQVYKNTVQEFKAAFRSVFGGAKKLLILDLDDTLWGGIVGDDGWKNLKLGGHDYVGEAFQDFQKEILKLKNQGVVLAIASKNDENTALEAIQKNTEMVLRREHFSAWRINWNDKAQNIQEILTELNLTAHSAVFLDDNPVERKRVKDMIPEIEVPEMPADKTQYRSFLSQLNYFDSFVMTEEDQRRTQMYQEEKKRESARDQFQDHAEWLMSLETKIEVKKLNAEDLERTHQLFNKTNQMNLTTRRMTSEELLDWSQSKGQEIYTFRVSDKFGAAGLTGILGIKLELDELLVTDFILSCRVMGRMVEESMLALACQRARQLRATQVLAKYIKTEKNNPCLEFFKKSIKECKNDSFIIRNFSEYQFPKSAKFIGDLEN